MKRNGRRGKMEDYTVVGECENCGERIICDILPSEAIKAGAKPACYCGCTVRLINDPYPKYWKV